MNNSDLLLRLQIHRSDNPKKMKKAIAKVMPLATEEQRQGLLRRLYTAKNPVEELDAALRDLEDTKKALTRFAQDGCHGFIQIGREFYPVKLDTRENWLKEKDKWCMEDERLIATRLGDNWMAQHDKGYFNGRIILFQEYGFSGEPHYVELRCVRDTSNLQRVPGTNLFVDKN